MVNFESVIRCPSHGRLVTSGTGSFQRSGAAPTMRRGRGAGKGCDHAEDEMDKAIVECRRGGELCAGVRMPGLWSLRGDFLS